jgi:predicted RNA-binding protein with RPS1 domain
MRRLAIDPWEEVRRKYSIGTIVTGKVGKIVPQGAVVELESDLEGFLPVSELATRRINTPDEVVQVGQELEMLVIDLQLRERRIVLSLRKLEQKRERTVVETVQRRQVRNTERTTLGDLFGHLFEEYEPEPTPVAAVEGAEEKTPAAEGAAAADTEQAAVTGETAEATAETEQAAVTGEATDETAAAETIEAVETTDEAADLGEEVTPITEQREDIEEAVEAADVAAHGDELPRGDRNL